jgi:pilus assembly protein Flp/PilA
MIERLLSVQQRLASPLRRGEEGQGMVEYALVLVLVAVLCIVLLTVVGKQASNVFSNVGKGLNQ